MESFRVTLNDCWSLWSLLWVLLMNLQWPGDLIAHKMLVLIKKKTIKGLTSSLPSDLLVTLAVLRSSTGAYKIIEGFPVTIHCLLETLDWPSDIG